MYKKKNEVVERMNLGESRVGGCQDLHFTFPQEFDRATLLIEDRRWEVASSSGELGTSVLQKDLYAIFTGGPTANYRELLRAHCTMVMLGLYKPSKQKKDSSTSIIHQKETKWA